VTTVLLTGATGFLGSQLARRLLVNYRVILLKRSFSNTARIDDIIENVTSYDIDHFDLKWLFKENRIDFVVHTATAYGRKGEKKSEIAEANILFPLKLLDLSLESNISGFINTDTITVPSLNEYALSKSHFREWLGQCRDQITIVNMKLDHMYGPKDNESKFVTYIIKKMLNSETLQLTPGEQKRDFIYVDDVVDAYVKVLEHLSDANVSYAEFEVGTGKQIAVRDLVHLIHQLSGSSSDMNFGSIPYRKNEIMESYVDISRLTSLGWKVNTSLREGLMKTIEYERGNFEQS